MNLLTTAAAVLCPLFLLAQKSGEPDALGYFLFHNAGKTGVADEEGNAIVPAEYDKIGLNIDYEFYQCYQGDEFVLVRPQSGRIHDFSMLEMKPADHNNYWVARTRQGTGILGPEFEVIVPPAFDKVAVEVETYSECCMNFIAEKDGKKGIYLDAHPALEVVYDEIKWLGRGFGILVTRDGKKGLLDESGSSFVEIIPPVYDHIELISGEDDVKLYAVSANGLNGVFIGDYYGEPMGKRLLIPAAYEKLDFRGKKPVQDTWYVADAMKNGRKGHVVLSTAIIESRHTFIQQYKESQALGMLFYQGEDGLWGAMNSSGGSLPASYEDMMGPEEFFKKNKSVKYTDDFIAVKKEGKWGAIDSMGTPLAGFEFGSAEEIEYSPE